RSHACCRLRVIIVQGRFRSSNMPLPSIIGGRPYAHSARLLAAAFASLASNGAQSTELDPNDVQRECLALAMYWEARSEGPEGMRAVGSVVLNRVEHEEFPKTPCDVVHQGGETPPCQFSWWCDGKSDRPQELELWETAMALAAELLEDRGEDPTRGALFFHSANIG